MFYHISLTLAFSTSTYVDSYMSIETNVFNSKTLRDAETQALMSRGNVALPRMSVCVSDVFVVVVPKFPDGNV